MEQCERIRVGGLKLLDKGACLVSFSPGGEFRLGPQVTGPLAQKKIILTFLTHVAGDCTALCTTAAHGGGNPGPPAESGRQPGCLSVAAGRRHRGDPELRERMDRFDEERSVVVRELAVLLGHYAQVLAKSKRNVRTRALREMAITTRHLQRQLFVRYKSFLRNSYRRYSYTETELLVEEEAVRGLRKTLVDRFESSIEPDFKKTLDIMRAFIHRLEKENYE